MEDNNDRFTRWEQARDKAPTNETMAELQNNVRTAKELLDEAEKNYRIAAVEKAVVYGWTVIAKDLDISPKMLHSWWKKYCPEMEDLSEVPTKEARKEERRAKKMLEKAEEAAREAAEMEKLAEKIKERKARINALMGA